MHQNDISVSITKLYARLQARKINSFAAKTSASLTCTNLQFLELCSKDSVHLLGRPFSRRALGVRASPSIPSSLSLSAARQSDRQAQKLRPPNVLLSVCVAYSVILWSCSGGRTLYTLTSRAAASIGRTAKALQSVCVCLRVCVCKKQAAGLCKLLCAIVRSLRDKVIFLSFSRSFFCTKMTRRQALQQRRQQQQQ